MGAVIKSKKEQIIKLYQDQYSGPEIAEKLSLTVWQVYGVLRRNNISRRSTAEQNRIRFEKSPLSYKLKKKLTAKEKDLKTAALMLYYGEGAKSGFTVDLANSDPVMLKIFIKFLREICRVDENRIRLYLYCFEDQSAGKLIDFWCNQLKVRKKQFVKPYIRSGSSDRQGVMPHGVLHVRYSDKRLLQELLLMIKDFSSSLV